MNNIFRVFFIPDLDLYAITYVSLVSFGFKPHDASLLANKIKTLYLLCEHRLSQHVNHHFGLKNIANVLKAIRFQNAQAGLEFTDPFGTVATVLKQVNVPQLMPEDVVNFVSMLGELFPGISNGLGPRLSATDIEARVRARAATDGYTQTAVWIEGILDLYEMCNSRRIVSVCGPSCSGKSAMLATLSAALGSSGQKQQVHKIYSKAISSSHLIGYFALETSQWCDGIFSALWRSQATRTEDHSVWISLDGLIDPVWIEGLNSILDEQVLQFLIVDICS